MRFHDVQDTRRPEVKKAQRDAAVQMVAAQFLERLSLVTTRNTRVVPAFGATFTI